MKKPLFIFVFITVFSMILSSVVLAEDCSLTVINTDPNVTITCGDSDYTISFLACGWIVDKYAGVFTVSSGIPETIQVLVNQSKTLVNGAIFKLNQIFCADGQLQNVSSALVTITPAQQTQTCSDTDWFGQTSSQHIQRLATKGTCTDQNGMHTDYCADSNMLTDYYCGPLLQDPKSCMATTYGCQAYGFTGCSNGACINETVCSNECSSCDPNDGVDYVYRCNGNMLQRTYCGNYDSDSCCEIYADHGGSWFNYKDCSGVEGCDGNMYRSNFQCLSTGVSGSCSSTLTSKCQLCGCAPGYTCQSNGVCVDSTYCTDTDGGSIYVKGVTKGYDINSVLVENTDFCSNSLVLINNYCRDGLAVQDHVNCPYGCQNGACISSKQYDVVIKASDPSDSYVRDWNIFTVDPSGTYQGGGVWSAGSPIKTAYFTKSGTWSLSLNQGTYYLVIGQSGGASYGTYSGSITVDGAAMTFANADVNHAIPFTVPYTATCTDSDGGENYYVKGTTTGLIHGGGTSTLTDSCYPNNYYGDGYDYLLEYYCLKDATDGKTYIQNNNVKCQVGCVNGACVNQSCSPGYTYGWTSPSQLSYHIQTCVKSEVNVPCTYLSGTCNRTTYMAVPKGKRVYAYADNEIEITDVIPYSDKYYYSWRFYDGKDIKRETFSTSVGYVTKITQDANQVAFSATSAGSDSKVDMVVESIVKPVKPVQCVNHDECSQACDSIDDFHWSRTKSNSWTGTCPSGVYGCMTGDCGIGQCNSTTGICFCKSTNVVDIYGSVCPAGTTCGSDLYCHSNTTTCTDSDNGKNYFVKGTTTGPFRYHGTLEPVTTVTDSCLGDVYNTLMENYCNSDGTRDWLQFMCPNGCEDGACTNGISCFNVVNNGYFENGNLGGWYANHPDIKIMGANAYPEYVYAGDYSVDVTGGSFQQQGIPLAQCGGYPSKLRFAVYLKENTIPTVQLILYSQNDLGTIGNSISYMIYNPNTNDNPCSLFLNNENFTFICIPQTESNKWYYIERDLKSDLQTYRTSTGPYASSYINLGFIGSDNLEKTVYYDNVALSVEKGSNACIDSDGGNNPSVRGYASGYAANGEYIRIDDRCLLRNSAGGGSFVSSCSGTMCAQEEAICSNGYVATYSPGGIGISCEAGCKDGVCLNYIQSEEYKTVVLGEDFYISKTSNSPYMWTIDSYDKNYLEQGAAGSGCSSTGRCTFSTMFKTLKEGTTKIIMKRINTNNREVAEVRYIYVTIRNMVNFQLSVKTDKYTYSPGETVNIISTLTGENYIDFSNSYIEFSVTGPDNSVIFLNPTRIGAVSSGCLQSETGTYSCVLNSSYSFLATYPTTQDSILGMYKANVKARIGETTKDASSSFEIKSEYTDYVDVSITPKEQTTTIGNPVSYRVVVKDNHPLSDSRNYAYEIEVNNLPYNLIQPKLIAIPAGSSTAFDINIFPSSASTERGVETTTEHIDVADLSDYRQSSPTGAFILTSYPIAGEGGGGSVETVPIEVAAFKFTVSVTLVDDPTVRDSDTAVLYVKYSNTPQPPDFPEDEIITEYLREGWNLLNLPGKGTNFVDTTCSLQRKPFAYAYLHDQRRYVSIQEAAITMGMDPLFEYVSIHPLWIYSYENCEISVRVAKYATYSGMHVVQGWNMIGTTKDMVGETMNSIKGNCEFENIYRWNADSQSWEKMTVDDLIEKISNGLVVKASSDCNLKQNSIQPPIVS